MSEQVLEPTPRHVLQSITWLLDEVRKVIHSATAVSTSKDLILFDTALKFGHDTVKAASLVVDERLVVQAFCMMRPFVELSLRLRWAMLADRGLLRLRAHYGNEWRSAMEDAQRAAAYRGEEEQETVYGEMARWANSSSSEKPMPYKLPSIFREIIELEFSAKGDEDVVHSAKESELEAFLIAHMAAHGNPLFLKCYSKPNAKTVAAEKNVASVALDATENMLRAIWHYFKSPDFLLLYDAFMTQTLGFTPKAIAGNGHEKTRVTDGHHTLLNMKSRLTVADLLGAMYERVRNANRGSKKPPSGSNEAGEAPHGTASATDGKAMRNWERLIDQWLKEL